MIIVPVYASVLALIFVALSVRTLLLRRNLQIAIGDAECRRRRVAVAGQTQALYSL